MGSRIYKISKYKPSIFQGSFRFSTPYARLSHRAGFSLTMEHPTERAVLKMLVAALMVFLGAYVYFVSASVLNVIARKEALAQTATLSSTLSLLERDYYTAGAAVTPSEGERFGLAPVSDTQYVYRPGTIGAARVVSNGI